MKRVVFASSVNAVNGYPVSRQSRASDVPFPGNVYGASKAWGEAVCAAFVAQSNGTFSAIAIRIGGVTAREAVNLEVNAETQAFRVTYHDLARLFDACVSGAPHVTFAVVNGISNNRYLRMDLEETRQLVGYHPRMTPSPWLRKTPGARAKQAPFIPASHDDAGVLAHA